MIGNHDETESTRSRMTSVIARFIFPERLKTILKIIYRELLVLKGFQDVYQTFISIIKCPVLSPYESTAMILIYNNKT